jgi:hypothetical protein
VVVDRLAADHDEEVRKEAARTIWRHEGYVGCKYAVEKLKDEILYGLDRSPVGPTRARQALLLLAETAPDPAAREALEEQAKNVLMKSKGESQRESFSEKRLGTIHAGIGSIWPLKFCDLIFTESRLIVARTGSNWWIIGLILTLLLGLIGFGGFIIVFLLFLFLILGFLSLMKRNKVSERLSSLPPDKVLTDSKDNFSIPYDEINKVELRKSWMMGNKLAVYTSTRKHSFILFGKKTALAGKQLLDEYEKIVRSALPGKLGGGQK